MIPLRQAMNRLCMLMGMPPEELNGRLGQAPIPVAAVDVAVGIPADLLRRRPDVRRNERCGAGPGAPRSASPRPNFYPHISIAGTFGWSAQQVSGLFAGDAFRGTFGPTFNWNILQYGRLVSNIRAQDAEFQALVVNYQNTVLNAGKDVEDGLVTFLRAQKRRDKERIAVTAEMAALKQAMDQYKGGLVDYNRVVPIQERLVERQQTLAVAGADRPGTDPGLLRLSAAASRFAVTRPRFSSDKKKSTAPVRVGFGVPVTENNEPTAIIPQDNRSFKITAER